MASLRKEAVAAIKVEGADSAKVDFQKVRDAIGAIGDEAKVSASKILDPMEAATRAIDRFEKKYSETGRVTRRDVETIVGAQLAMDRAIQHSGLTLDQMGEEAQRAYNQINAGAARAREGFVQFEEKLGAQRRSLNEAGATWRGLFTEIETGLGSIGAKAAVTFAAFTEGWQIGRRVATFLKTDFSEFDGILDRLGTKGAIILRSSADAFTDFVKVLLAGFESIKTRSLEPINQAWQQYETTWKQSFENINTAITGNDKQVRELAKTLGIVHDTTVAAAGATDEHAAAQARSADAARKLIEEERKLAAQVEKNSENLADLNAELEKQKNLEFEGLVRGQDRSSQLAYYERDVERLTSALKDQSRVVEDLTARYGENDPMTRQAAEKQADLERQLERTKGQVEQTSDEVAKYNTQQKNAAAAAEGVQEKITDLTAKQAEAQAQQAALANEIKDEAYWRAKAADATGALKTVYERLAESAAKAATPAKDVASATEKSVEPMRQIATHGPAAASSLKEIATIDPANVSKVADQLERIATAITTIAANTSDAINKLDGLAEALGKVSDAAGSDEDETPSSGEHLTEPK